MTSKEQRMAALRLDAKRVRLAARIFDEIKEGRRLNGGCDDLYVPVDFGADERAALVLDCYTWNGDSENAEGVDWIGFSEAHGYLTAALLKFAAESLAGKDGGR